MSCVNCLYFIFHCNYHQNYWTKQIEYHARVKGFHILIIEGTIFLWGPIKGEMVKIFNIYIFSIDLKQNLVQVHTIIFRSIFLNQPPEEPNISHWAAPLMSSYVDWYTLRKLSWVCLYFEYLL